MLKKRASVPQEQRELGALTAAHFLINSAVFKKSKNIACYFSQESEFQSTPIIQAIWNAKKKCYLPMLSDKNLLEFSLYLPNGKLRFNRYQILEPEKGKKIAPGKLDLVLMPLVGFDLEGHRLGMGGGYYDRTFNFMREGGRVKPCLLGLGYAVQQAADLPQDAWDVKMDGVLTEDGIYYAPNSHFSGK